MDESSELAPTPKDARIVALDVLRGFALFGVLMVNLPFLAMPTARAMSPPDRAVESGADVFAWVLVKGLFEMKFVAIFSFLFGMGLVLQWRRAQVAAQPFGPVYLRRLGLLGLIGLLHGFLLFEGDILFPYALAGLLLFLCRFWPPRRMVLFALIPLGIGTTLSLLWGYSGVLESAIDADTAAEVRAATIGPLSDTLSVRASNYVGWLFLSTLISFNWRVLALFFLGAAAMRAGLMRPDRIVLHRAACVFGLGTGGAIELVATISQLDGQLTGMAGLVLALIHEGASLLLTAGYVGTIAWMVHTETFTKLAHGLACVGRLALTNYLLQSVVANVIFYWYGFGLYDQLTRAELVLLTIAIFGLQMLASVIWLRFFRYGPVEWLWRSLTYRRWQVFR